MMVFLSGPGAWAAAQSWAADSERGCWDLPAELKDLGKFSAFTEKISYSERSVGGSWFDFSVNSFIVLFQHA